MEKEKRPVGRPATGRTYPHKVFGYVDDEGLRLLRQLAARTGAGGLPRGESGVVRDAIRALAEKEGVE